MNKVLYVLVLLIVHIVVFIELGWKPLIRCITIHIVVERLSLVV